jgi:2-keto-4-pentenoate hydratase/2-oxohepta-3-ene-1,7-dioic acid hydratase in catechol pathway
VRIASYSPADGGPLRGAICVDGHVVDAAHAARAAGLLDEAAGTAGAAVWRSAKALVALSADDRSRLSEGAAICHARDESESLEGLELGPPIPDPEKIICIGLNYRLHADEVAKQVSDFPDVFTKFRGSLIGHGGTIEVPDLTSCVDWEGELAVVIGSEARNVGVEDAMDHIAGCMAFNDVSARDLQMQTSQWTAGKAIDTFAPCGPWLVTLDDIGDPGDLVIRTRVNGNVMQESHTGLMIHSIAKTVSFLSQLMLLKPGDIIATGTPEGVGMSRTPPQYLAAGDVVEVEVERVGSLVNTVGRAGGAGAGRPLAGTAEVTAG